MNSPPINELDGRDQVFRDELLDKLVGEWKLTRKFQNRSVENSFKAQWVLNHQFLQLHMKDVDPKPAYEAFVYIGYDNANKRYVVHWIDVFGGRFSESLGYGTRLGESTKCAFEYPDGPFLNTFSWNAKLNTWVFVMHTWVLFAEDNLIRQ